MVCAGGLGLSADPDASMNADPDLAPAADLIVTTEVKILLPCRFETFCNILKQVYFC